MTRRRGTFLGMSVVFTDELEAGKAQVLGQPTAMRGIGFPPGFDLMDNAERLRWAIDNIPGVTVLVGEGSRPDQFQRHGGLLL